ncbi:MAG: hypothetical protein IKO41_00880 [Lachnospiraceae bacterium]|nr:hypothetical protein [Lachnospiraceae bacterium]
MRCAAHQPQPCQPLLADCQRSRIAATKEAETDEASVPEVFLSTLRAALSKAMATGRAEQAAKLAAEGRAEEAQRTADQA